MNTIANSPSTLYLCYFGLREPLVQTQVLPYLRQLRDGNIKVSLLTFEPDGRRSWSAKEENRQRKSLLDQGIHWHWLPYHKRPSLPATLYDILVGAFVTARLGRRESIDVLHGRAHVAAAMGALARPWCQSRLIFDVRGLVPDEYVDAGVWSKRGLCYRLAKWAEKRLLATADGYVVLTERAREILFPGSQDADDRGRPIEVIPCCVDADRFRSLSTVSRDQLRQELSLTDRRVIVYTGALGGWYLTEQMAEFLALAHQRDAATFSMILTQSPPDPIVTALRTRGVSERDFTVSSVPSASVPRYLRASDLAISFIKPCYSKMASSPTKIAEYLASGLPVICNAGVGDIDAVIEADRVGVLISDLEGKAYAQALDAAYDLLREPDIEHRCQACAVEHFDLRNVGGARYLRLYHRLLGPEQPSLSVKHQQA